MREILFKAKTKKNYWTFGGITRERVFDNIYIYCILNGESTTPIKEETICQYTGINDCDGEMIYEGDLMNIPNVKDFVIKDIRCIPDSIFMMDEELIQLTGKNIHD